MKFKKKIKPFLMSIPTALALFITNPTKAEQVEVNFMQVPNRDIPTYNIKYSDNPFNVDFYVDGQTTSLNFNEKLKKKFSMPYLEQIVGAKLLLNNDPVWNTTTIGTKYNMAINSNFLKNELTTLLGYQYFSSVKEETYKTGQFFLGGENYLAGKIKKENKNLEGKIEGGGIFGGYISYLPRGLMIDNHKLGYKLLGEININDLLTLGVDFENTKTKFNTEKYFFVNELKEINYGFYFSLHPFFEDIGLSIFIDKEIKKGKELNDKIFKFGVSMDFQEIGATVKVIDSINNKDSNLILTGSKYFFDNKASIELFSNLNAGENIYGLKFVKYFDEQNKKERLKINYEDYDKRVFVLIKDQGYEKPSEDFEETIEKTNTLTKIGNIGNYIVYGPGEIPARNPLQAYEKGYGDCDELSWYRTYAARINGFEKSWDISYFDESPVGHAFFLVQDKDGRVYVTDNDTNVWLKVNINKDSTKEEMADAALKQLSNYLAKRLEDGKLYFWQIKEPDLENIEKRNIISESEDWKKFKSEDPGHVSYVIDTGLISRIGMEYFY